MLENLSVETYSNGEVIPQVQDKKAWANLRTGAWCYHDNDASNGPKYGKLYNWYAVNDPRGLAPKGFHIPSLAEWNILTSKTNNPKCTTGTLLEDKITSGITGWDKNGNGTNSSGFAGRPGGGRGSNGTFDNIGHSRGEAQITITPGGDFGLWWSSTEVGWGFDIEFCPNLWKGRDYACSVHLVFSKKDGVWTLGWRREWSTNYPSCIKWRGTKKVLGFSVRCLRD